MTAPRPSKSGRGTLYVIAGLMIASAVLRVATEVSPAIAEQLEAEMTPQATAPVEPDEGSLLAALQAREQRLVEGETRLRERMAQLRAAEAELETQINDLMAAEAALGATIARAEIASETDVAQLTTVYENMKPKEAAALFEEMPPQFAAGFLGLMRPDAAAAIMTQLEPETAYAFSVVLAGRNAAVPTD